MPNKKVVLEGRGPLTLRDSDYVTAGGEGSIYKANATVVKLYTDPLKMARDGMAEKVKLLKNLNHPSIVAPQGLVLDEQGKPLGFYMPWVEGEPLSRVFVTDFRTRTNFGDKQAMILVNEMRESVRHAHSQQAVMVDANELNWLVGLQNPTKPQPYIIDVDSWAVGKWPAKVIMPSIRDWHASHFDEKTDWFAWGVVTFQVFTGIHPYKGGLDGYKPGALEQRMKANASVFTQGVRLPQAVRDFATIPGPLLDWYQATFQQGARTLPPSPFDTTKLAQAAKVMRTVMTATGALKYQKLFGRTNDPVLRVWPSGAAWLGSGIVVDLETGQNLHAITSADAEVVRMGNGWLLADWQSNNGPKLLVFTYVEGQTATSLSLTMQVRRLFRAGDRLFAVTDRELVELQLRVLGKPLLTLGQRWSIMPNAMQWFEGVAVADMLGASFLYLPVGNNGMVQVRVPELDGLKPLVAKAGNRFVSIIGVNRQGDYQKLELTFSADYQTYKLWQGGIDTPNLNAALLPKGVTAAVLDDGELTIFVPTSGTLNKIKDRGITTAINLTHWGDKVVYLQDGNVWQVSTS
jgi:hypothetical protein